MSDHTIRFRVTTDISDEVREAFCQLGEALDEAASDDDVTGFSFNKRPEALRPTGSKLVDGLSPIRNDFCISLSTDFETGEQSCTIMWT